MKRCVALALGCLAALLAPPGAARAQQPRAPAGQPAFPGPRGIGAPLLPGAPVTPPGPAAPAGVPRSAASPTLGLPAQPPSMERAVLQTHLMQERLNLSADQALQVQALNLRQAERAQSILRTTPSSPERQQQLQRIADEHDAALQGVLSRQQYEEYLTSGPALRQALDPSEGDARGR